MPKKMIALLLSLLFLFAVLGLSSCSQTNNSTTSTTLLAGPLALLKPPYLLYPNDNTQMTVKWQTTGTMVTKIEWGATAGYGAQALVTENGSGANQHQFSYTITGLAPATRTYYRVTAGSAITTGSFLTAPAAAATALTFYAYGDNRDGVNDHENVMSQLLADLDQDPDNRQTFCLHAGDMVRYGEDEAFWTHFFPDVTDTSEAEFPSVVRVLASLPNLMALGNHDTYRSDHALPSRPGDLVRKYWPFAFYAQTDRSYYSFDYGPAHFTVLDQYCDNSSYTLESSAQYSWMVKDLTDTAKPWKIVMFHEPAWTASQATGFSGDNLDVQRVLCPVFKDKGVKLVIQGHAHYYARCNPPDGLTYVTLGGGGAMLSVPNPLAPSLTVSAEAFHFARFDIAGNNLDAIVIDDSGVSLDAFSLTL
jgi:hypothetical protein